MADTLAELTTAGVAIWLDDLSRARLVRGQPGRLIHDSHVVGVTTNPTIFAKAISGSDHYDRADPRPRRPRASASRRRCA